VTGAVDATGCDIGVYYSSGHSGSVNDATITGENCFGVLVNGASVNVVNSHIPVSAGTCAAYPDYQFGIVYLNGANCSKGRCNIQGNVIALPVNGKDGVVAKNPGTNVAITGNVITGYGPDGGIAQNGIEIGGAMADIRQNAVSGFEYTGTGNFATAILIYGGPATAGFGVFQGAHYVTYAQVQNNNLRDNDLGVYLWNQNTDDAPPPTTNNGVSQNKIVSVGPSCNPFAAGITDEGGKGDSISGNTVYGTCY
jgi:hypothetical protein